MEDEERLIIQVKEYAKLYTVQYHHYKGEGQKRGYSLAACRLDSLLVRLYE